jgi:hypothetical protein
VLVAALWSIAGCADGVTAEHESSPPVGPGSEHARFAALDECCDLLVGAPSRGQLEVLRPRGESWAEVGSFFAAGHPMSDVVAASVGGRPSLFVAAAGHEVTLLSADLVDPHRLRAPVGVFEGDVHAIAAGDLDRDGIDELVVTAGERVVAVDGTEWALFEDPSEHPRVSVREIDAAHPARAVAVAELTGDGAEDVVAFHRDQAAARVYDSPGVDHESRATRELALAAPAIAAVTTSCARAPVVVLLDDGSVVAIRRGEDEVTEWATFGQARAIFTSGDAVVLAYEDGASMTLHDACGGNAGTLDISSTDVLSVALSRRTDARRMAVVRADAPAASVFRVDSPF